MKTQVQTETLNPSTQSPSPKRPFRRLGKIDKKTLREFLILGVIALACLGYIIFRGSGNINYTLPRFNDIPAGDITRLEIIKPGGESLVLSRTGEDWVLPGEGNFSADPGRVNRLLSMVTSVKPIDMVSQAGRPERYDLDETARFTLRAYKQDNLVRELYIGKTSDSGSYSYVLFPGNRDIFSLRGSLKSSLDLSSREFRNKTVLKLNREEVSRIRYTGGAVSGTLLKNADGQWEKTSGGAVDPAEINDILSRVTNLSAADFADQAPAGAPETGEPFVIIWTADREYTLTLYPRDFRIPPEEAYPEKGFLARVDSGPLFLLARYTADRFLEFFAGLE
ncbi:MAG: DUF4340 domain-containing protein [Spirochaetales bacterium]|jgi:hypothetical protein|nr:DUF4340 domain-containing protein [Spirochaetales bacterium]